MQSRQSSTLFSIVRFALYSLYLLALGALFWLAWQVRDLPFEPPLLGNLVRVDSLSAFFGLLTLLIALIKLLLREQHPLLTLGITLLLLVSYGSSSLLIVAAGYLLATLLSIAAQVADWPPQKREKPVTRTGSRRTSRHSWLPRLRRLPAALHAWLVAPRAAFYTAVIWSLFPCISLGLAYAALETQAGTWRYSLPIAGAGLSSLVFWFVLLAALIGSGTRLQEPEQALVPAVTRLTSPGLLLALAWVYPLARLYSLGPWNLGWHFATLLLGGATALWAAWRSLRATTYPARVRWLVSAQFGLALAGIGLGTSAGLAAGCYALLTVPLLVFGLVALPDDKIPASGPGVARGWSCWFLSGGLPLTAPFVAAWMGIGAAAAAQMFLLSVTLWMGALLSTLTMAHLASSPDFPVSRRRLTLAAGLSLILGGAAPGIVRLLINPIVQQLQGGVTPFGDIALWPWGGLLVENSARQPIAALPSATIIALMLITGALAWLLMRLNSALRRVPQPRDDARG